MKKLLSITLLSLSAFFCACTISQSKRDDVSFVGLKTFYVDAVQNSSEFFKDSSEAKRYNDIMTAEVVNNLTAKGFINVATKAEAQITFVPIWNVSLSSSQSDTANIFPTAIKDYSTDSTAREVKLYATIEIQAFLKDDNRWAWRGFSPIQANADNITTAMLKNQVIWALEKFPPERYETNSSLFEIFQASKVTQSERAQQEQEVAKNEQIKQQQKQQAMQEARQRAQEKIQKSTKAGETPKTPTQKQIEAEYKTETIADIDKIFSKALEKRSAK